MENGPIELCEGIPQDLRKTLEKQQYYLVGEHSGVKLCKWTKDDIRSLGSCYKYKFYGIESYRCLQASPALTWCTERCSFCWRGFSYAGGDSMENVKHENPEAVLDGMIEGQRYLMSGFGGHPAVPREKWERGNEPKHVAISLSGEPTLYEHLDDFIKLCHDRGMTTFLVTNGTNPEVLANLQHLPTQLYLTVAGGSQRVHSSITRPFNPKQAWKKMNETIDLFPSLDTRKVLRMTLVKEKNMVEPEKYAEMFLRSEAHFLEAKGFVSVGDARNNHGYERMPKIEEIVEFSEQIIAAAPEIKLIDKSVSSCVTLMAKEDYPWRIMKFDHIDYDIN
ncbi:MAG: 4-demethylwyosine synthase TYW1 [Candidatus Heimdallarchaeota archaeon]|nr:4-demethylwyosine synthase TYW1 [Candidatus Heimdallarchaeota archaeon]